MRLSTYRQSSCGELLVSLGRTILVVQIAQAVQKSSDFENDLFIG